MNVGAVLVLGTGPGFSVQEAQRLLGERARAVPRLRQRLRRAPPGCGRPFWAGYPAFDLRHHVRQLPCPPPGDERALLEVASAVTLTSLPPSRPLWSATFVTGLADDGTGLVIVMNHVLADGMGGLAVLATLVDEAPGLPTGNPGRARFPVPAPGTRTLAADAGAIRALPASRGDELDLVTASVPVSARQAAADGQLGQPHRKAAPGIAGRDGVVVLPHARRRL
jgi:diacylglycerol O-acyltransferase / wax synthase